MDNIFNIPKRGLWSESTSRIDQNFTVFGKEIDTFDDDTQKCKGLFPSLSSLITAFPEPVIGSWAYIGDRLPALVYVYRSTEGWISTGKTGGDSLDPSNLANSVTVENVEDIYSINDEWIYGYSGENWSRVNNNQLVLRSGITEYQIRLTSLLYGEVGELLEQTTTDPYLYTFSSGSFVSMNLLSSDGISKTYTENILSWTVDNTFFTREVNGQLENRLPIVGDTIRATLNFRSPGDSDIKVKGLLFKFIA